MFTSHRYCLLAIVGWSLFVHLPGIRSPLLDYHAYRQCQTADMARNYQRDGMRFLSPELDTEGPRVRAGTEFPMYSYLLAILFRLFGTHEILGRLLSCAFAAGGAVFLFLFIKPRLGVPRAFWSALVMCSLPVHIYFTRTVQPEPMALWALLGFLYFSDRWLRQGGKGFSWSMALLMGSLSPLLKLPFLYLILPLWFFLGYERFGLSLFRQWKWTSLSAFLLVLTLAWYHYAKTAPVVILPLTMRQHLSNLAPILTRRLWQAQFVSRVPELVTTYSGLALAFLGFRSLRNEQTSPVFWGWFAASVVYVPLLGDYGLIHRYTLLPLTPIAAVGIASGILFVQEKASGSKPFMILLSLLVLGIPLHAALRIKHWYRVEYPYMRDAHDVLAKVSGPDDLVLVATHESPVILYYVDRCGYAIDPGTWQVSEVEGYIKKGVRFILIPLGDNPARQTEWKRYLTRRGVLVREDPGYWLYRMVGSAPRLRQG